MFTVFVYFSPPPKFDLATFLKTTEEREAIEFYTLFTPAGNFEFERNSSSYGAQWH